MTTRRSPWRLLLPLAVLVAVVGGLVWWRWPTVRNLFDSERFDAAAAAKLDPARLTAAPTAAAAGGWPQWRGPNRDGQAPAGPLRTDWAANPPKVVWSAPCGGGYSSLAVVGGRVYGHDYADGSERVFCLDAADGKPVWEHKYPVSYSGLRAGYAGGPRATPTVHDGRVYAVGATGLFLCLEPDPAGGPPKEAWRHDLPALFRGDVPAWGVACSPLVEGELVVVQPGGRDGLVAAFDRRTGDRRWAAGKNPAGYSSPVVATLGGVRQVVAVAGDAVLGVAAADGAVLWSHPWVTEHRGNIATPVVVGDSVFVSSGYNKGCALLLVEPDGSRVRMREVYYRKNRVMRNHHSTSVYRDGHLYGFDNDELKCVDLAKGEAVAAFDSGRAAGKGSVILADQYLVGLTESGTLFLADADPTKFTLRGEVRKVLSGSQNWAAPVLVDGRIYLRDEAKVVCLDVR